MDASKVKISTKSFSFEVLCASKDWADPIGIKWWKLKGLISRAKDLGKEGLYSIGGAYSNHLLALAHAAHRLDIPCAVFVKGHKVDFSNPILKKCEGLGMQIEAQEVLEGEDVQLRLRAWEFVPEGGAGDIGELGVADALGSHIYGYDQIWLSEGSGTTCRGLERILKKDQTIKLVSISRNPLFEGSRRFGKQVQRIDPENQYGDAGFARHSPHLLNFINQFWRDHQIPLDPIYNAKLFRTFYNFMEAKQRQGKSLPKKVLLVHSGGAWGALGFHYRFGIQLEWLCHVFPKVLLQ